jgi:hypothetical protein
MHAVLKVGKAVSNQVMLRNVTVLNVVRPRKNNYVRASVNQQTKTQI